MWETIRGYLTFTRKERIGVLFLLLVISLLFILPHFFKPAPGDPDPAAYDRLKEAIRKLESIPLDSSGGSVSYDRYKNQGNSTAEFKRETGETPVHATMFYFDPNTINAAEWRQLGLSPRLVQTILHYIERGGRFRKREDLKKLYGLHQGDYERLLPFVRIAKPPEDFHASTAHSGNVSHPIDTNRNADVMLGKNAAYTAKRFFHSEKKFELIDINDADSLAWSAFPGIGAKLASRIVHFRLRLGGFYQVDQVAETFGLPDSTFQNIKPFLQLKSSVVHQIDLNMATQEILQDHPYIHWQLAKSIVNYRQQHGGFKSVDELMQLAQMNRMLFDRLKPYLMVNR